MSSNYLSKSDWIRKKNQERDECYKKIDESANRTKKYGNLFKQYLDIQTRFNKYSVGNALLISLQMPNTTLFRTEEDWNKLDVKINQNAQSFKILEPSSPIERPDGKKATYYNPKDMYDISQTNAKPSDKALLYSDEDFLKALVHTCPVKVEVVDELEDKSLGAEFDESKNILFVCRGMDTDILFQSISFELSKILENKEEQKSELESFENYCISYMICKKYGKSVENYDFEKIPPQIQQMDVKDFRAELVKMRNSMNDIVTQIDEFFNKKERNRSVVR